MSTADTDRLRLVHEQLVTAVTNLTDSAAWQQMLTVAARLPTYSPHNVVLIASQRPDATRVAGYAAWRKFGRQVRGGEHGIAILAPVNIRAKADHAPAAESQPTDTDQLGESPESSAKPVRRFRAVHVFDIAQTDGPDLAEVSPRLLDAAVPAGLWDGLAAEIAAAGFTLTRGQCAPANGVTDHAARTVTVMEGLPEAQAAKTLAHELAHVRLHGENRPADMDRSRAEVEAESVAYIVTTAHGMDARDYTVPYVAGWAGGQLGLLVASAERVLSTAGEIITATSPPAADRLKSSAAVARRAVRLERGLAPTAQQSRRRPSPGLELAQ